MNGVGASEVQSQSLLSTASPADISGAGSTSPPSQQFSDSTSPNSTQNPTNSSPNESTAEENTTPEPNETIAYPLGSKDDGKEMKPDKGREHESVSEGGVPQPSTSVKAEETGLESVNVQIELLEHTPDVVVDDGQDWAPDGDHEMKRVKVSAFTSTFLCPVYRDWLRIVYIHYRIGRAHLRKTCLSMRRCTN
jgi:protein phosphatase 4 regulatory subunit 3